MIFTDRTITVRKGESKINEPIIVYRGDYELEVRFTIMNSKFKFMSGTNLIESENAAYGQLAILTPYGGNIFSEVAKCNEGTVTFVMTEAMLDQIEEVGLYSFQIRLFDYIKESRISIPPVEFGIVVREPITSEDHDNSINNAIVGYAIANIVDPNAEVIEPTFDSEGNYNKTIWKAGDRITQGKLNRMEDAIDTINQNEINNNNSLNKQMTSNFNVLQSQIDNMVIESGNTDVEVEQARGDYDLLHQRLNAMDETDAEFASQLDQNTNKLNKIVDVLPTYTEAEINNTIASLTNGGTVIFRNGVYNGIYKLQVPNVDLIGELAEINGKIVVGSNNGYTKFFSKIEGFNFNGTGNHIEVLNTQRFSILNNNFKNGDKAIYIKEGGSADHANEVIDIQFNKFEGVNYCLYVDKHNEGSWMNTAEINFSNNPITKPKITTLHFECGVDGLTVYNNLFYMFPHTDTTNRINKKHHIYIKEHSCFVNIQNNQFFESGEESIKICSPSSLIINGNHFAWNCQKDFYNVIQIIKPQAGVCYATIANNMFSQFTKHCLGVDDSMLIRLTFNSNIIEYADSNISYFGEGLLSSFIHYAVALPRASRRQDFKCEGNTLNASETDNIRLTTTSETETTSNVINGFNSISMLSNHKITVSSGNTTNIIEIVNSKKQANSFGGLIIISARSSLYGDSVSSTYIYGVNRLNGNDMELIEISKAGALSGTATTHTSFKFSATQNTLQCTPIGSTSGNFYINIMAIGDIAFVGE